MNIEREVKPGSDRHIRRIENEKKESHGKKIHRVGYDPYEDDFDPQDLVKAFNAGQRIDY